MNHENDSLILDLVEWVAKEPRTYVDAMDAWRTSCPRLTVWEDTFDRGYIDRVYTNGNTLMVVATAAGQQFLLENDRIITISRAHG